MDHQRFQQALRLIGRQVASRSTAKDVGHPDGGVGGQPGDAGAGTAEHWDQLAIARLREGDPEGAAAAWEQALQCDLDDLAVLHRIGEGLRSSGRDPLAFAKNTWSKPEYLAIAHRRRLGKRPHPDDWLSACLAVLEEDWKRALHVVQVHHDDCRKSLRIARNLAFLLERLDQPGRAQCTLAATLLAKGDADGAAAAFLTAPEADAQSPEFLKDTLLALRKTGQESLALQIAETAANRGAYPVAAWIQWAEILLDLHRYEDAYAVLRQGMNQLDDWTLRLQADLILPAVPASQAEMERAHSRVHSNLRILSKMPLPESETSQAALTEALTHNFYVGYLGKPCVDELRAYASFMQNVVKARFPQYAGPIPSPDLSCGRRIRIGYVTMNANDHTVARYFSGWLQHADREAFEVQLFPLTNDRDWMTGYLTSLVEHCHPSTIDVATSAQQIRAAKLDVLVYTDIGMDPLTASLGALRLAPVQCVAGGHPVTTGLASMDYFLSNQAMEPDDAASHYTERLVTLAGTGVCMPSPALPAAPKSRGDFGLPQEALIYLSAQSLFKYLPKHDELFARIARQVENAMFVFAEGEYPAWTRTLRERLGRCFRSANLDPDRHIRFLPRLGAQDFFSLNILSDVFLDTIGWSGGMTAFDAIGCDLPMVVLPGKLMRGRQSYGMLMQMGIEDTIAKDTDDYVRIAVELGLDRGWRADVASRIRNRRHLLFEDTRCVKSLEAFFRWSVGAAQPGDEAMFKLWPDPGVGRH